MKTIAMKLLSTLSKREQYWLLTGALVLLLSIGYAFLWKPWSQHRQHLLVTIHHQQRLLPWLVHAVNRFKTTRPAPATAITHINDAASLQAFFQAQQLAVTAEQTAPQQFNVRFDELSFAPLLISLTLLQQRYQLIVARATLLAHSNPGYVSGNLQLQVHP